MSGAQTTVGRPPGPFGVGREGKWVKPGRGGVRSSTLVCVPGVFGRVLVVDDNKVIRQLIRVNLELEGFEVVTAADGAECLDLVHRVAPDVITLDAVMPRLDGLRTATWLRSDPLTCRIPLAIISACTQQEVERGLAAGVDAFLAKPFEPAELVLLVGKLMRLKSSSAAARARPNPGGSRPAGRAESALG
jgi:CheY-like chemotaxis protein